MSQDSAIALQLGQRSETLSLKKKKLLNMKNRVKKKLVRNEESLSELSDNIKRSNSCESGVPEGKEGTGQKKFLKIMSENFTNWTRGGGSHL